MSNRLFSDRDFDRHFTATEKTIKRSFIAIFVIALFWGLLSLAVTGGLIYVAIHFIAKVW